MNITEISSLLISTYEQLSQKEGFFEIDPLRVALDKIAEISEVETLVLCNKQKPKRLQEIDDVLEQHVYEVLVVIKGYGAIFLTWDYQGWEDVNSKFIACNAIDIPNIKLTKKFVSYNKERQSFENFFHDQRHFIARREELSRNGRFLRGYYAIHLQVDQPSKWEGLRWSDKTEARGTEERILHRVLQSTNHLFNEETWSKELLV